VAHCPFERLSDLASELESIRKLPAIKENKPGILTLVLFMRPKEVGLRRMPM